jgi:hypothetical protein
MTADWVEGADDEEATGVAASGRVQRKGSPHTGKRAKSPRVPPGCTAPPTV